MLREDSCRRDCALVVSCAVTAFRALLVYFLLIALAHLVFLATSFSQAADITQIAAMPVLVLAMVRCGVRDRLTRWLTVGLVFSWLGDTVPRFLSGDAAFLSMVGAFLLAQVALILGFAPRWRSSITRRWPLALVPYLALFVVLVVMCLPGAGSLAPAVVVYGVALLAMAVLSTGVNLLAGAGGALFFVSDGLIALGRFADGWPVSGAWQGVAVMTTYFAAQLLLVLGVVSFVRGRALEMAQ